MHRWIARFIDFFYPPFHRLMTLNLFRYFACGGLNVLIDWVLYFFCYNIIFHVIGKQEVVDLLFVQLSPKIAALVFTFPIVLLIGFYLSRNISFQGSSLRGRVQLFRYMMVVAVNLAINYVCLTVFVDYIGIYPTPSKMITTVFTTAFSYFAQKHFSFQKNKE